jgi:hypothetical protein
MSRARAIGLALLLVAACGAVWAADIDYGVTLDDQTTYGDRPSTTPDKWEQRAKAAVWVAVDFSEDLTLDAQVSYLNTNEPLNQVDVDVLTLSGSRVLSGTGVVSWVAGRQQVSDPTALVLSHKADGVSATLGTPLLTASVRGAYTGLLLKPESNLNMSAADLVDDGDDDVYFAPKRLVVGGELSFPEVWARQTPLVFFLAQFDLRSDSSARVSTQYSGVKVSGPLAGVLYWDAAGVLETGRDEAADATLLGLLGTAGVRYYDPKLAYARVEVRGLYASGSQGSFDGFLPISAPTLGLAYAPPLSDLMGGQGSVSVKPLFRSGVAVLESVQLYVDAMVVLTAVDPAYSGTLVETGMRARPFSDLGLALKYGVWLPDGGDLEYAVRLEASVAL